MRHVKNILEKLGLSSSKSSMKTSRYEGEQRVYNKVQNTGDIQEQEWKIRLAENI